MKARFKVGDELALMKERSFTRAFPHSRNSDGSVGATDIARVRAGELAKIYQVHESRVERVEAWYDLEFEGRDAELKIHLKETEMLELFEPLT
jgi:hypothetical protein